MFSSEICKIFKNTYFQEHLRTTASLIATVLYVNIMASVKHVSKEIVWKKQHKWNCISNFEQLQHWQTLTPSFNYTYISLEGSYGAALKKGLMRTFLFKSNQRLKLYIIICILYVLIIFMIYQTVNSFPSTCKSWPTRLRNRFSYISEMFQVLFLMCTLIYNV